MKRFQGLIHIHVVWVPSVHDGMTGFLNFRKYFLFTTLNFLVFYSPFIQNIFALAKSKIMALAKLSPALRKVSF